MMRPTAPRPDAGLCYCCGQTFAEPTRVHPEVGQTWRGALERHTGRGVCPRCYNTYGVLHGHAVAWDDDRWREHHRDVIAQQDSPRALRRIADSLLHRWPDLSEEARDRAARLSRRRATLDTLDLAARIKGETDAEELLWLAEALDSRSPELARLARRRATGHPPTPEAWPAAPAAPDAPPDTSPTSSAPPTPDAPPDTPKRQRRLARRTGLLLAAAMALVVSAVGVDLLLTPLQSCGARAPLTSSQAPAPHALPPGHPPVSGAQAPCPFTQEAAEAPPAPLTALPDVPPRRLQEPGRFVERGGLKTLLTHGYEALHATEFDRAMGYFDRALKLNPHSPEAYIGQGHVHLAQGHMPWAIGAFETAHRLDPTQPEGLMTLATTYERMGDRRSALRCVERLLKRYPEHQPGRAWRDQLKASLRWEMPALERIEPK